MLAFVRMSFIPVCVVPFTTRMFVSSRFNSEQNVVALDSSPCLEAIIYYNVTWWSFEHVRADSMHAMHAKPSLHVHIRPSSVQVASYFNVLLKLHLLSLEHLQ